ncbi:hypothetical protein IEU95_08625 [Hoyosella rhizosphaerae]|uniref:Uncharacterized protein n=1 Tax=Hoyosella rhizosphaerae TaxID=1755582 RepID=A0A916U1G5_9ACTN|nr:hypothetical protein [Hoyosella rhizosphaerae]MBN4926893.1 hypothetical protein [Hoyosella rhizosphaerae]GGC55702.1 hypothetical protein GCM10011410_05110 [Hoyosella rhizosphaerae]
MTPYKKYAVLGTLVDRAVCMPYSKPYVLCEGIRQTWWNNVPITADIINAADALHRILQEPTAERDWSTADFAVDPAGPWWSKTKNDFFQLSLDDQSWLLAKLVSTAARAAEAIEEKAVEEKWTWLWSQPSLAMPGDHYPQILRPDLVAGLDKDSCVLIDLKTTKDASNQFKNREGLKKPTDDFHEWSKRLKHSGFNPKRRWILSVSTGEEARDPHKWIGIRRRRF